MPTPIQGLRGNFRLSKEAACMYVQLRSEVSSADPEGGAGGPDPPLENHKLYGFL